MSNPMPALCFEHSWATFEDGTERCSTCGWVKGVTPIYQPDPPSSPSCARRGLSHSWADVSELGELPGSRRICTRCNLFERAAVDSEGGRWEPMIPEIRGREATGAILDEIDPAALSKWKLVQWTATGPEPGPLQRALERMRSAEAALTLEEQKPKAPPDPPGPYRRKMILDE